LRIDICCKLILGNCPKLFKRTNFYNIGVDMGRSWAILPIALLLIFPLIGAVEGSETVVDQKFRINPGEYKSWEFESDGHLTLYISAVTDYWTFSMYLLEEEDFQDLKNNRNFDHSEQASTVYDADLVWEIPDGTYHVVVINEFDNVSVNLELSIETESTKQVCCGSILIGSVIIIGALCALIILIRKRP